MQTKVLTSSDSTDSDMGTMVAARKSSRDEEKRVALDPKFEERTLSRLFMKAIMNLVEWWEQLQEPPRTGCLFFIVSSQLFTFLVSLVILFSSGLAAYTAEWEMRHVGQQAPPLFEWVDRFVLGFFAVEVLMRMAVHRTYFFVNVDMKWNLFDLVVVSISTVEEVLATSPDLAYQASMGYIRIVRFLRLAKILRVFRLLRVVRALSTMLNSFHTSSMTLLWCFLMLLFVLFISSLVFMHGVSVYLETSGPELGRDAVDKYLFHFGSIASTSLTLFMAVSGGSDWENTFWILVPVGRFYGVAYLGFIFFYVFAVFNILTGIFVERAVEAAAPDREEQILAKRRALIEQATEFKRICGLLDLDKTGTLSLDEFKESMRDPMMVSYLASVGLPVHDVELFFHVIAGSANATEIDINMFVEACMTMHGQATALDMKHQVFNTQALFACFKRFERACNEKMDHIMEVSRHLMLAYSEASVEKLQ